MLPARPSISPQREPNPVGDGLGAKAQEAEDCVDDEFLCRPCIFGVEDDVGEELMASEEEEQATRAAVLPSPVELLLASTWTIASPITPTSLGALTVLRVGGENLVIRPARR